MKYLLLTIILTSTIAYAEKLTNGNECGSFSECNGKCSSGCVTAKTSGVTSSNGEKQYQCAACSAAGALRLKFGAQKMINKDNF